MRPNFFIIAVLIIMPAALAGCRTNSNKISAKEAGGPPEQVAGLFFKYLDDFRFEEARQLATDNTIKTVNFVETLVKLGGGNKVVLRDSKSECTGCTINGKEAICTYKTFSGGEQKVYLLRQKGRWKVDLRKDEEKTGQ